jgi:heptosyltransferase-1
MRDILFIKTSSLGDVIHHMPALTEARRRLGSARLTWVVEEAFAPLLRLHPGIDDVIPVASRRWRGRLLAPATWREVAGFARTLRRRRYDEIVDSQGLVRSALIARIARGRRHGFDRSSVRERPAAMLYDVGHRVARDAHAIARNRMLTGLALGYTPDAAIDYGLDRDSLAGSGGHPYGVLLHATARPEKEWPEPAWIALGRALEADAAPLLLLSGNALESARSLRIAGQLMRAQAVEQRPLDEVARLIAGASFVVGVDTGLVHLAAALAVPTVAIFVASDPGLTGPVGAGPLAIVGVAGGAPSVEEVLAACDGIT